MAIKEKLLTKQEALVLISAQMRRDDIDSDSLIRLTNLYAQINGWFSKEKTPSRGPGRPKAEPTIDDLVAQVEKRRKQVKQ